MARKSNKSNGTSRKNQPIEAPEGFDVNVGGERGEGWVVKADGNTVQGRLIGRRTYKGGKGRERAFYQIELHKPCLIQVENPEFNEDEEESDSNAAYKNVTVSEGIVNVDEFKKLEDLRPFVEKGGVYDVWFVLGGKVDIDNGQTMWTMKAGPKCKVVKLPSDGAQRSSF